MLCDTNCIAYKLMITYTQSFIFLILAIEVLQIYRKLGRSLLYVYNLLNCMYKSHLFQLEVVPAKLHASSSWRQYQLNFATLPANLNVFPLEASSPNVYTVFLKHFHSFYIRVKVVLTCLLIAITLKENNSEFCTIVVLARQA